MIPGDAEQSQRVFTGAREMVDIWAVHVGARLARPKGEACLAPTPIAISAKHREPVPGPRRVGARHASPFPRAGGAA